MTAPPTTTEKPATERIVSLDALRGFDMFWIIGGEGIVLGMHRLNDAPWLQTLGQQMDHVPWAGCHFYDLIFPLFVFLMGTSSVFSLSRIVEREGKRAAYGRIIRRSLLLYALGVFYYGGLSRDGDPEMFRFVGVLQRIAICYLFGSLLLINLRLRGMIVACAAILLSYWAIMALVPIPEVGTGNFEEGTNVANYVDKHWLPGYKWDGDWDPEGLLSNLPAIASGIFGMFAGMLLVNPSLSKLNRVGSLVLLGVCCIVAGHFWGEQFPIIKKLWTSSYVVYAAGWSYLMLAAFYLVIDVWNFRIWARPFIWIGMNSITIYMFVNLINFESLVHRVLFPATLERIAPYNHLTVSILASLLAVGVCGMLYRKKIFLRV